MKDIDNQLFDAAKEGNLKEIKRLLKTVDDIHAIDYNWILRTAAYYGYLEIVKELLQAGADVHAVDNVAFRWAAENGHFDIVKELLKAGADPKAVHNLKELLLKGLK